MTRRLVLLAGAWILSLGLPALVRTSEAAEPPTITGWIYRGGAYLADEPLAAGQPRATGLQSLFPPMRSLGANPMTPEKVELGKLLFFDPVLSGKNDTSCAHCHHPDHGFTDGRKLSMGFGGRGVGPQRTGGDVLGRGAPSLWNAAYSKWQFWDGRAEDLETQAAGPITNEHEMGEKPENLVKELKAIPDYVQRFQKVFGGDAEQAVTFANVTRAVAAFERTLLTFNSAFDRYAAGNVSALSPQERDGMKLFRSLKTRCFECHNFPTFADDTFRVIGVPETGEHDRGRACVKGEGPDGAFKTPSLRNIALTAPYMHNGAFDTLEDVIKFYAKGGGRAEPKPQEGIDDKVGKFDITDQEIADLTAFLKSLTDTSLQPDPPASVPSGLPVVAVKTKAVPAPALALARAARPGRADSSSAVIGNPDAAPSARAVGSAPLIGFSSGNMHRVPGGLQPSAASGNHKAVARTSQIAGTGSATGGTPVPQGGATFTVAPGQLIQAAIDRCQAGDRVEVAPGVYHQSLTVAKSGITLSGLNRGGMRAILDGQGTLPVAIQISGSDFTIEGFTIRHYKTSGIAAGKDTRVTFRDMILDDAGRNGVQMIEPTILQGDSR